VILDLYSSTAILCCAILTLTLFSCAAHNSFVNACNLKCLKKKANRRPLHSNTWDRIGTDSLRVQRWTNELPVTVCTVQLYIRRVVIEHKSISLLHFIQPNSHKKLPPPMSLSVDSHCPQSVLNTTCSNNITKNCAQKPVQYNFVNPVLS
jgi:hypothetical protein